VPILEASRLDVALPAWRPVAQNFTHRALASVPDTVRAELAKPEIAARITPGMRVALGVGSRGIRCLAQVVKTLVEGLQAAGARPFIVPAMGSHGGGTAEGQIEVLASYGVTEAAMGAPIRASMDTVELGTVLDGTRVFLDRIAYTEADAIVPVARVKPHTDFRGEVESGLHKMLGIGFGKHRGASYLHSFPLDQFGELIPAVGQFILERARVPFGIAIVEDSFEDPAIVEAVPGEGFARRERELLELAKAWLPRLPFDQVDVLVVQEVGKNISGSGMDPNVTGRFALPSLPRHVQIGRLVALDLTEETHGNATGLGAADVTTRRAARKIDWHKTYTNHVTACVLEGAKLPLAADTDQEAIAIAVRTLWGVAPERVRLAWIKNTLELQRLWVTEPLWQELSQTRTPTISPLGEFEPIRFAPDGTLLVGSPTPAAPSLAAD
jgi:Domain of unknown function (DUF362)